MAEATESKIRKKRRGGEDIVFVLRCFHLVAYGFM